MCTTLLVEGRDVDRQGELADLVPTLHFHDYWSNGKRDDACLCPVDVEATLDAANIEYSVVVPNFLYEVNSNE